MDDDHRETIDKILMDLQADLLKNVRKQNSIKTLRNRVREINPNCSKFATKLLVTLMEVNLHKYDLMGHYMIKRNEVDLSVINSMTECECCNEEPEFTDLYYDSDKEEFFYFHSREHSSDSDNEAGMKTETAENDSDSDKEAGLKTETAENDCKNDLISESNESKYDSDPDKNEIWTSLIKLQSSQGFFTDGPALWKLIGKGVREYVNIDTESTLSRCWTSGLIIALLEDKFPDDKLHWQSATYKAIDWMESQNIRPLPWIAVAREWMNNYCLLYTSPSPRDS